MPELFVVGCVGAILTFILANLNLYFVHRSFADPKVKILNDNLGKIGWYWSLDQGSPSKIEKGQNRESLNESDYQKATRAAFLFGTMMFFLSWLGFAILGLYMVSIYKVARNRTEEKIMNSDLARIDIQDKKRIMHLLSEKADIKFGQTLIVE